MNAWRASLAGPCVASTLTPDDGDTLLARVLKDRGEGVVVDDRRHQDVRLAGDRGLHVRRLLFDRAFRLREDHLAIGLSFRASVVEPFLHRLPNVFEGEEWIVKAILTEAASAEPDNASERRRAHSRQQPHHVFPPDVFGAVHGRSQPSYSAFETRTVAVNLFVMSGASSMPRPGPGGTVMNPSRTAGSAVTRSRYHVL